MGEAASFHTPTSYNKASVSSPSIEEVRREGASSLEQMNIRAYRALDGEQSGIDDAVSIQPSERRRTQASSVSFEDVESDKESDGQLRTDDDGARLIVQIRCTPCPDECSESDPGPLCAVQGDALWIEEGEDIEWEEEREGGEEPRGCCEPILCATVFSFLSSPLIKA